MHIDNRLIIPLKLVLAGFFLVLTVIQTLSIPGGAAYRAQMNPELAYLRWPETLFGAFMILCVQVVVVAIWRLLGLVQDGRIFSRTSFVWVDAMLYAIAAGWVVLAGVFALVVMPNADDPGGPIVIFLVILGWGVVGLLLAVMRTLLHQAASLRADLDEVI